MYPKFVALRQTVMPSIEDRQTINQYDYLRLSALTNGFPLIIFTDLEKPFFLMGE